MFLALAIGLVVGAAALNGPQDFAAEAAPAMLAVVTMVAQFDNAGRVVIAGSGAADGNVVAAVRGNDQTVRLWQVASGRCHCALRLASPVVGIAWHPGGSVLCAVGGAGVYVFNYQP